MHGLLGASHPERMHVPRPRSDTRVTWRAGVEYKAGDCVFLYPEDETFPHYVGRICAAFVDESTGYADPHCIQVGPSTGALLQGPIQGAPRLTEPQTRPLMCVQRIGPYCCVHESCTQKGPCHLDQIVNCQTLSPGSSRHRTAHACAFNGDLR
jgi:hypothetical protein